MGLKQTAADDATACTNEAPEILAVCHAAARKSIAEAYARLVGFFDDYGIDLVY